jgi:hypothetical protein
VLVELRDVPFSEVAAEVAAGARIVCGGSTATGWTVIVDRPTTIPHDWQDVQRRVGKDLPAHAWAQEIGCTVQDVLDFLNRTE